MNDWPFRTFPEHHIVPQGDRFESHVVIQDLTYNGLFDIQSSFNKQELPADQETAELFDSSPHTGNHLSSYYNGVQNFLDAQIDLDRWDAANNLYDFVDAVRYGLVTGQVYANTP